MTEAKSTALSRPTLGFALEGLSGREETLFKAIVRLLDHRTIQRWVYQPSSPDLRVVAGPCVENGAPAALNALKLTLSSTPMAQPHCLGLPLRADELEQELNLLGAERLSAMNHKGELVRLLRWPPATLIGTTERIKLAALLVGGPSTLDTLQRRSGFAPELCAAFFASLRDAGLLVSSVSTTVADERISDKPPAAVAAIPASGLIARIRQRLGQLVSHRPA